MRIGIDLGGTKTELAVLNKNNEIVWRRRLPSAKLDLTLAESSRLDAAYQQTLEIIFNLLNLAETENPSIKNIPVGIGTPGSENSKGMMRNCNSVWLNGRNLRADLHQRLQRPVRLANDANCFALAEQRMGAAQNADSVFGVILGTGVGGGLVYKGDLLQGANRIAGEWGHNPVPGLEHTKTRICYCGKANCLEMWLSGPGLSKSYLEVSGQQSSAMEIVGLIGAVNSPAAKVWDEFCERLALSLAQIINIVDPDVIVLGGGLSNVDDLYAQLPRRWGKAVFTDESINTRLCRAMLGDSAGVYGAAWLW